MSYFGKSVLVGLLTVGVGSVFAQSNQSIGSDVKDAGKATGRAAKKTGHKIKKGAKKATNSSARAVEKGADKVGDKTQ